MVAVFKKNKKGEENNPIAFGEIILEKKTYFRIHTKSEKFKKREFSYERWP